MSIINLPLPNQNLIQHLIKTYYEDALSAVSSQQSLFVSYSAIPPGG